MQVSDRIIEKVRSISDTSHLESIEFSCYEPDIDVLTREFFKQKNIDPAISPRTFEFYKEKVVKSFAGSMEEKIKMIGRPIVRSPEELRDRSKLLPVSLHDFIADHTTNTTLQQVLNYVPADIGITSIGKGEFFLVLSEQNAAFNLESCSDLKWLGENVEVKGKWSKLANMSTHSNLMSNAEKVRSFILKETGKEIPLKSVCRSSLSGYYQEVFSDRKAYSRFLKMIFNTLAHKASEDLFDYVDDAFKPDGTLDVEELVIRQAAFEFLYYVREAGHDKIFFFNPEKSKVLLVDGQEDIVEKINHFTLSLKYCFVTERSKAIEWKLR